MNHQFLQIRHKTQCVHPRPVGGLDTNMEDSWVESALSQYLTRESNQLLTPPSIKRTRGCYRDMSEFVCHNTTKYLKRMALKCQVLAVWEGGTECAENMLMKWKDKGTTLKDVEGPATHPLN